VKSVQEKSKKVENFASDILNHQKSKSCVMCFNVLCPNSLFRIRKKLL